MVEAVHYEDEGIAPEFERSSRTLNQVHCFVLNILNSSFSFVLILVVQRERSFLGHYGPARGLPFLPCLSLGIVRDQDLRCADLSDEILVCPMQMGFSLHAPNEDIIRVHMQKELHIVIILY